MIDEFLISFQIFEKASSLICQNIKFIRWQIGIIEKYYIIV